MQDAPTPDLDALLARIAACRLCRDAPRGAPLPHEPRPVVRFSATARLLIAGQAPGVRVHRSGLPFDDPSGERLRDWMGIDRATFYDTARIAIAPMGFCFPGLDPKGSDLPPRPECRAAWHDQLFALAPQIETILVVGGYAQAWHLTRLGHARLKGEGMTALAGFRGRQSAPDPAAPSLLAQQRLAQAQPLARGGACAGTARGGAGGSWGARLSVSRRSR